jgi:hypothetical protein
MTVTTMRILLFTLGIICLLVSIVFEYKAKHALYNKQIDCAARLVQSGVPRSDITFTDDGCKIKAKIPH